VLGHLRTLIPGDRLAQAGRDVVQRLGDRLADCRGVAARRQRDRHIDPVCALHLDYPFRPIAWTACDQAPLLRKGMECFIRTAIVASR
jgi:hypothetical protein